MYEETLGTSTNTSLRPTIAPEKLVEVRRTPWRWYVLGGFQSGFVVDDIGSGFSSPGP